jgi:hypothetical protein
LQPKRGLLRILETFRVHRCFAHRSQRSNDACLRSRDWNYSINTRTLLAIDVNQLSTRISRGDSAGRRRRRSETRRMFLRAPLLHVPLCTIVLELKNILPSHETLSKERKIRSIRFINGQTRFMNND